MDAAVGPCTVIIARPRAADSKADDALLRAVENAMGVPRGALVRTRAMARPEFRLVEGVDRRTADRLAGVAGELGFRPRVRDRLGIRWSNQPRRDGWGPLALMMTTALGAALAISIGSVGSPLTAMLLAGVMVVTAQLALRWRMSQRFLPLVLDSTDLVSESTAEPVDESSPVRQAASRARKALDALRASSTWDADRIADFRKIQRDLHTELDQLEAQGELLHQATVACFAALDGQLAWLAEHPEAPQEAMARVQAAIDAEDAAIQARDVRIHEIVAGIVAIERTANNARNELQAEPRATQPAAELGARAAALRRGQTD